MSNTTDFHNMSLQDAEAMIHSIIGKIRMSGQATEHRFITGHGVIRVVLLDILKGYGLEGKAELGNAGIIRSLIE